MRIGVEVTSKTKHSLFFLTLQPCIHSLKKKKFIYLYFCCRHIFNHWANREVPHSFIFDLFYKYECFWYSSHCAKSQRYLQRWNKPPHPLMNIILPQDHRLMSNYWYDTAWQVCESCRWSGNRRESSTQPQEEAWVGFRAEEWIRIHQAERWESIF